MNEARKPYKAKVTDTQTAFGMILEKGENPIDLTGLTVKFLAVDNPSNTVIVAEASTNVQVQPTTTFTVDTTENFIKAVGHVVQEGNQVVFATETALPGGLTAATRYFACDVQKNAFKVSAYEGSAPIDITSAGTGAHTFYVVGHAQHDWQTAHVAEKRKLRCWFKVFDGSNETATIPNDEEGWPVWLS